MKKTNIEKLPDSETTPNAVEEGPMEKEERRDGYRRENFYKYDSVRPELLKAIDEKLTAKEAAEKLRISVSTFHKYRGLLSTEMNKPLSTPEELAFLNRKKNSQISTPPLTQKQTAAQERKP